MHNYQDLITLFNQCFLNTYQTQLVKGDDEPIYLPKDDTYPTHRIYFAHGFYSSALHECSHWLIAGKERRQLEDFGYWYVPDGRNKDQQKLFQQVEVKPQALEWILSTACDYRFKISIDNLSGEPFDTEPFKTAVYEQVLRYCEHGLPKRAAIFRQALTAFYHTNKQLTQEQFERSFI